MTAHHAASAIGDEVAPRREEGPVAAALRGNRQERRKLLAQARREAKPARTCSCC